MLSTPQKRPSSGRRFFRAALSCLALYCWDLPSLAQAELGTPPTELPKPEDHPRKWVGSIDAGPVVPLLRDDLCPRNAACIFGSGLGIRADIELRWPSGWAFGLAYDLWALDGDAVYRVSTLQALMFTARYVLETGSRADPYGALRLGPTLFGGTFRAESVGGAADIEAGVELELTQSVSVSVGFAWRTWMTQSFVTEADRVVRSEGSGVAGALQLVIGVTIFESR